MSEPMTGTAPSPLHVGDPPAGSLRQLIETTRRELVLEDAPAR